VHLHQVVDIALSNLKPLLAENHVTLCAQVPCDLPPIKADLQQLRQVFESLLLNAVKHNAPGLTITLNATIDTTTTAAPRMVHCAIADNGRGMDQNQCDRLFQLYVRGIDNQHLTGIGLGLHRCRQVITAHGGQVGVASRPGEGSQFWFTLPLADGSTNAHS
jgi:signal transduction histidine kinase